MKNRYSTKNLANPLPIDFALESAYEQALQDAIETVVNVKNPNVEMLRWDFEEARKIFVAALKSEDGFDEDE